MTDLVRMLEEIERQCRAAREALADEHEGNVKRAAHELFGEAIKVYELVTSW